MPSSAVPLSLPLGQVEAAAVGVVFDTRQVARLPTPSAPKADVDVAAPALPWPTPRAPHLVLAPSEAPKTAP